MNNFCGRTAELGMLCLYFRCKGTELRNILQIYLCNWKIINTFVKYKG